jgi:hypothetical protein
MTDLRRLIRGKPEQLLGARPAVIAGFLRVGDCLAASLDRAEPLAVAFPPEGRCRMRQPMVGAAP